jgi:hypothetical protein
MRFIRGKLLLFYWDPGKNGHGNLPEVLQLSAIRPEDAISNFGFEPRNHSWVRSGVTHGVNVIEGIKLSMHAAFVDVMSGQLRFLG